MIDSCLSKTSPDFQALHRGYFSLEKALVKVYQRLILDLCVTPIANPVFLEVFLAQLDLVQTALLADRDATLVAVVVSSCEYFEVGDLSELALAQGTLIISAFLNRIQIEGPRKSITQLWKPDATLFEQALVCALPRVALQLLKIVLDSETSCRHFILI